MPLQALIFDVGGVIIPHDNAALYARLASRCRAVGALEAISDEALAPPCHTGEAGVPELYCWMVDRMGYEGEWDAFAADFCSHLSLDPGMLDFVAALARTNRVLLFSNTNAVHWAHADGLAGGRLGAFEAYLSHELGVAKPDPAAFALVAERAGLEPGRCLFIDDVMANVEAARRAGFQAEQFTSQPALAALLGRRGVVWPDLQTGDVR